MNDTPLPTTLQPKNFPHQHAAHCETGVAVTLLKLNGFAVSEAMAFGLGEGLFFGWFPFLKIMDTPAATFRHRPGRIFQKLCQRLGVRWKQKTFRNPMEGMEALDACVSKGQAVGLQTNIYWLSYVPKQFRFPFNAHNIVAFAKEGESYHVSDPVFENTSVCPSRDLLKARFAKGMLSPKGRMYWVEPGQSQLGVHPEAVKKSLKANARTMLQPIFPIIGIKGMMFLANRIEKWPKKCKSFEEARLYLGQIVRMAEEIGTGGAGFRFLYSAYLQEAAEILGSPVLATCAEDMLAVGDAWREFARLVARLVKSKSEDPKDWSLAAAQVRVAAEMEKKVHKKVIKAV